MLKLPCGTCIECKLARSRMWAIRCVHEANTHDVNCFVTLTYSPEELEKYCPKGSLNKREYVLFMKRLRKEILTDKKRAKVLKQPRKITTRTDKVRFFHAGEYGEKLGRPHHHACLFGLDFADKVLWKIKRGVRLYTSETLERVWGHGYCVIGEVTYESAAYVARYILKKITGEDADEHYDGRLPEYTTMSRRPGIGKNYFDRFKTDIYNHDRVELKNRLMRPPRYYDGLYEAENPEGLEKIKINRKEKIKKLPKKTKQQVWERFIQNRRIGLIKKQKNQKQRTLENEQ